ncbi:MAG: hypothetical protein AAB585_00150 [Patescibacteria group bacterium]
MNNRLFGGAPQKERGVGRWLLWTALLTVVLFFIVSVIRGQNGQTTRVMPLVVAGGVPANPGEIGFVATLLAQSNAQASSDFSLELRNQDGNPVVFGLREVTGGQISSGVVLFGASQILSLEPKEQRNFLFVFPSEISITTFWLNAQVPGGVNLLVQFDFLAMTSARNVKQFSFIRARPDAVKSAAFTVDGVLLGIPAYNPKNLGQREVVLAMTNPNNTAVTGTVTYRDQDGVDVKSVSYSVPAMGQNRNLLFLAGSAPALPFEGSAVVTSSAPIYLGIWSFENEFFTDVKPVPEIFVPNAPPRVNIEVEDGRVFTSSPQEIGGWAIDQDGTLANVQVTIDSGTPSSVPLNINRSDVQAAFPGSQLNSGWKTSQMLGNGQHTIKVSATDSQGATAEQTRSFSVNRPAVVPLAGEYQGVIDLTASTSEPPGRLFDPYPKLPLIPKFTLRVSADRQFVEEMGVSGIGILCDNGVLGLSDSSGIASDTFGIIFPESPRPIVAGEMVFPTECGTQKITFTSDNEAYIVSEIAKQCNNNRATFWGQRNISPCPTITLRGVMRKN